MAANLSVRENIFMNPAVTGKGVLEFVRRARRRETAAALGRFSIKAAGAEQPVATLSGGNQQKVVVARWMEARVRLLMLEEPTIGVDVGSKAEIYHLLQLSLRKGMAASADLVRLRGGREDLPSRACFQPRPPGGRNSRASLDDRGV